MVHYKLTYLSIRGFGEFIRYILSYGKADFEDVRIDGHYTPADPNDANAWKNLKPKTPMGQLPILEIDGKDKLVQSRAIGRYLAKQFGIAGQNDIEQAQADMYVDGCFDMFSRGGMELFGEMRKKLMEKVDNDAIIKEKYQKWKSEGLGPFLKLYEEFLKKNGTGFLVGSKVTWADIIVAEWLDCFSHITFTGDTHLLKDYPNLAALVKAVHEMPGIAEYVKKRPNTPAGL